VQAIHGFRKLSEGKGTLIEYGSGDDNYDHVTESPEQIITALQATVL
jgi:hypothetical protein